MTQQKPPMGGINYNLATDGMLQEKETTRMRTDVAIRLRMVDV